MRVLVTGGAGFIGSHLVRAGLEAGEQVRVLDDLSRGRRENLADVLDEVELVRGSLVDLATVERALAGCELVFHHGAIASVPASVADPLGSHAVNATGTLHVLEAARRQGVRRVVFASSAAVYGDGAALPKREGMTPAPVSPYALQKLAGELYCAQFGTLYGVEAVALRYFNVFGPRQDPKSTYASVIPVFVRAALKGERPVVHGDGAQSRDFVFVADVVAANRAAAAAPSGAAGGVFNVASGVRTSILELWERVCRAVGCEPLEPIFGPPRAGDVRHSEADVSRAAHLLGWSPRTDLSDGLAQTARHFAGAPS